MRSDYFLMHSDYFLAHLDYFILQNIIFVPEVGREKHYKKQLGWHLASLRWNKIFYVVILNFLGQGVFWDIATISIPSLPSENKLGKTRSKGSTVPFSFSAPTI